LGLSNYPLAVPASLTPQICALDENLVPRERLRAEWAKFRRGGWGDPGLKTMGLTSSVQVNIGYSGPDALAEIMTLGNQLSPFIAAGFANTAPYAMGR